jgi:hypothetical protein
MNYFMPASETIELEIFTRTCEELIADPLRLTAVIQRAGITDESGNLTERYGGTVDTATTTPWRMVP